MRRRLTRLPLLFLFTLSLVLAAATPALAEDGRGDSEGGYLATGDSVAFGTNPLLDAHRAANFIGYPDIVAKRLELALTNASCPGEASGGFISLTGTDNVCRPYRAAFPLHTAYKTSQLDFTVKFLKSHPRTRLVTIDIGANDLFVLQKACKFDLACTLAGLPAMLSTLSSNLDIIYGQIRQQAHYRHELVALTYYSTNYADPTGVAVISAINAVVADRTRAWGGRVADGFGAFKIVAASAGGDTCAAGLLIVVAPGKCDIHPSPRGRDILAAAVVKAVGGEGENENEGEKAA